MTTAAASPQQQDLDATEVLPSSSTASPVVDDISPVMDQDNSQPSKPERVFDARQQRINELRLKFCVRDEFPITKNMIHSDGTLNQE